jgi:hypothetical protein
VDRVGGPWRQGYLRVDETLHEQLAQQGVVDVICNALASMNHGINPCGSSRRQVGCTRSLIASMPQPPGPAQLVPPV